ncbi:MAG: hypothetical protein QMD85_02535, partial [Candidatus Aenigmarchaeota archaeon]|nr:hypothetical protein [Candidatus Aenigmarchaeota archaeon]
VGINVTSSSLNITLNNIFNNTLYNLVNNQSANISVPNNWWNSTNSSMINATVYDFYHNSNFGIANFTPVLSGRVR